MRLPSSSNLSRALNLQVSFEWQRFSRPQERWAGSEWVPLNSRDHTWCLPSFAVAGMQVVPILRLRQSNSRLRNRDGHLSSSRCHSR